MPEKPTGVDLLGMDDGMTGGQGTEAAPEGATLVQPVGPPVRLFTSAQQQALEFEMKKMEQKVHVEITGMESRLGELINNALGGKVRRVDGPDGHYSEAAASSY